ncbi:hypothetical protein QZH56_36510 [Streptomyces olivoreticuli]|uniref:hypothetical protein n=1 Tax=Streptomyces olivoreticuli TaxID=68246 RepID=UPI00265B05FC|nr:hypothetical protein [Streptomyces olivoreticuli]WKK24097.1 hypothetical protein QZH56_36510 [Streptomyces olivoreticuli]
MWNVRYGVAAAFVTGMALFAVGCTGGGADSGKDSSAQGSDASGKGKAEDDAYKYRQCLRENGAKVEEPKDGQAMGIQGDVKKALAACKDLAPGAGTEVSEAEQQKALDRGIKMAQCMRENGVDMPDPQMQDGSITAQRGDTDVPKEKIEKAMKVCNDKIGE